MSHPLGPIARSGTVNNTESERSREESQREQQVNADERQPSNQLVSPSGLDVKMLRWVITIPFGTPVEPEV